MRLLLRFKKNVVSPSGCTPSKSEASHCTHCPGGVETGPDRRETRGITL
ncbi:MAG: hypothetical protein JRI76_04255 [Deltaproteobacteria bacterium]|nr:hypothetical protein [Deltaproteobacteria bacterium]MBW2041227.1 hypothetical protein [Deltaproteobacteria bacterium]MBW2132209.1 hypothetical protein [Deltaproteobacteria bacterium]